MAGASPDPAALGAYTERLFAHEDALLLELRAEMERRGFPPIQVSAEEGRLLQLLLTTVGATRVLEIGTLGGYSALWMARALPEDGRLVTLEIEPEHAALAREFADRAGLADRIDVRLGPAADSLAALEAAGAGFDACFIDADKEPYPDYLAAVRRMVRVGGLIMGDNAFRDGDVLEQERDAGAEGVHRFNEALAADPGLLSTIIPVRDGLAVAVVLQPTRATAARAPAT